MVGGKDLTGPVPVAERLPGGEERLSVGLCRGEDDRIPRYE